MPRRGPPPSLEQLPDELLRLVVAHAPTGRDALALAATNKQLHDRTQDEALRLAVGDTGTARQAVMAGLREVARLAERSPEGIHNVLVAVATRLTQAETADLPWLVADYLQGVRALQPTERKAALSVLRSFLPAPSPEPLAAACAVLHHESALEALDGLAPADRAAALCDHLSALPATEPPQVWGAMVAGSIGRVAELPVAERLAALQELADTLANQPPARASWLAQCLLAACDGLPPAQLGNLPRTLVNALTRSSQPMGPRPERLLECLEAVLTHAENGPPESRGALCMAAATLMARLAPADFPAVFDRMLVALGDTPPGAARSHAITKLAQVTATQAWADADIAARANAFHRILDLDLAPGAARGPQHAFAVLNSVSQALCLTDQGCEDVFDRILSVAAARKHNLGRDNLLSNLARSELRRSDDDASRGVMLVLQTFNGTEGNERGRALRSMAIHVTGLPAALAVQRVVMAQLDSIAPRWQREVVECLVRSPEYASDSRQLDQLARVLTRLADTDLLRSQLQDMLRLASGFQPPPAQTLCHIANALPTMPDALLPALWTQLRGCAERLPAADGRQLDIVAASLAGALPRLPVERQPEALAWLLGTLPAVAQNEGSDGARTQLLLRLADAVGDLPPAQRTEVFNLLMQQVAPALEADRRAAPEALPDVDGTAMPADKRTCELLCRLAKAAATLPGLEPREALSRILAGLGGIDNAEGRSEVLRSLATSALPVVLERPVTLRIRASEGFKRHVGREALLQAFERELDRLPPELRHSTVVELAQQADDPPATSNRRDDKRPQLVALLARQSHSSSQETAP